MADYFDPTLSQDYIKQIQGLYGAPVQGAPQPAATSAPTNPALPSTSAPASTATQAPNSTIQSGNVTIGGPVNSSTAQTAGTGIIKFAVPGVNGLEERYIYFPNSVYGAMLASPMRDKWGLDQQFASGFPEIPAARVDEFRQDLQGFLTGNTLTSAMQSMSTLDYGFDPTIVGPPPGFAWSTDPITGVRTIVDTEPLVGPPLNNYHYDAARGQWYLVNDPSNLANDLYEGIPLSVRPWLQLTLDNGGDSSVVKDPSAKAWVDAVLKQTTNSSRRQKRELPFGMGLAYQGNATPGGNIAPPVMPQTGSQPGLTTPPNTGKVGGPGTPNYVGNTGSPRGGIPSNIPNVGAYNPNASNPAATRAAQAAAAGGTPQGAPTEAPRSPTAFTLSTGERPMAIVGNKAIYKGGVTWDITQGPPPAQLTLGAPGVGAVPGTVADKSFMGAQQPGEAAYNPVQGMPEDPANYGAIAQNAADLFTPSPGGQDFHFYVDEGGTLRAEAL